MGLSKYRLSINWPKYSEEYSALTTKWGGGCVNRNIKLGATINDEEDKGEKEKKGGGGFKFISSVVRNKNSLFMQNMLY